MCFCGLKDLIYCLYFVLNYEGFDMAGKSNKGRNKKGSHHPVESAVSADVTGSGKSTEPVVSADPIGNDKSSTELSKAAENGEVNVSEVNTTEHEVKESNNQNPENQEKQGKVLTLLVSHI